jgi:hypothetical protein
VVELGHLVEREADGVIGDPAQVEPPLERRREHGVGVDTVDGDGVEPRVMTEVVPGAVSAAAAAVVSACTRPAMRRKPSGPCHEA